MEKKANHFIALLMKKFIDDGLPRSEWDSVYSAAVASLKPGKLKTELNQNSGHYEKQLQRGLVETTSEGNLKISCHKAAKKLNSLKQDTPHFQRLTEQLSKIERFENQQYPELQALCGFLCGKEDLDSLVNVMFLALSSLQPDVEKFLGGTHMERWRQLLKELKALLVFFHVKKHSLSSSMKLDTSIIRRRYADVMASLLSIFVDLSLVQSRFDDGQTDVTELCSFVYQLLAPDHDRVIDVLLQLSTVSDSDSDVILPMARKCLKTPSVSPDFTTYTKYIACAKTLGSLFGDAAVDIVTVAESLKAPKNYLPWLREQKKEIVEKMPEDRKFKGRVISRFLMREADPDLIESLVDILTEEFPQQEERTEDVKKTIETETSEVPLFFLDTKGLKEKPFTERSEEKSEKEQITMDDSHISDVEVIEVDLSRFDHEEEDARKGFLDLDDDLYPSEDETKDSEDGDLEEDAGGSGLTQAQKMEQQTVQDFSPARDRSVSSVQDTAESIHLPKSSPPKVAHMRTRSISSVDDESSEVKPSVGLLQKRNIANTENLVTFDKIESENTPKVHRIRGAVFCHFCSDSHSSESCSKARTRQSPEAKSVESHSDSASHSKKQKLEAVSRKVSDRRRLSEGRAQSSHSSEKMARLKRKSLPSQLKRYNLRNKSMN